MAASADHGMGGPSIFQNPGLEIARQIASDLAAADITPPPYRGNVGNCLLALDAATRDGLSVLEVMGSLHVSTEARGCVVSGGESAAPIPGTPQPDGDQKPKRPYRKRNGGGSNADGGTTQQQTAPAPAVDPVTAPLSATPEPPPSSPAPEGSQRQPGDFF